MRGRVGGTLGVGGDGVGVGTTEASTSSTGMNDGSAATQRERQREQFADSSALTKLTKEKEEKEEENVQKIEEHILANLLPVNTKQLAAQQGATHNPSGMPITRRRLQPVAAGHIGGKGTFLGGG